MNKSLSFIFSLLAIILCLGGQTFAQETAGEIQGTVRDQAGAVVPNVAITITGVDVGYNRTLNTDSDGYYRAQQVPPGIYNVVAAPTGGFSGQTKNNVQVVLGQAANTDFDLSTEATAVVDVAGEDATSVDTTSTVVQENITAREIDNLPKGVNITSLLRTTTAVRAEPLSGQFQINGGSGSENTFIIDGQEVTNFRTGVLNGNNDLPFQIIQEVQVKASGFEAEFGGATGGVVGFGTKSGTNDFRGEFGLQFEPSTLQASPRQQLFRGLIGSTQVVQNINPTRDRFNNFFPTASFGGPIVKERLYFFANYTQYNFFTRRSPQFFNFNTAGVRTPLLVDSAGRDLSNTTFRSKTRNEYGFIKLDGNVTNELRLSSSFTYNPISLIGGLPFGQTTLTTSTNPLPSADFGGSIGRLTGSALTDLQGGRQNSNNFRIEGNYTPNSKLLATGRYSRAFLNEKLSSYFIPQVPRILCVQVLAEFRDRAGCAQGDQTVNNNNFTNFDVSVRQTINADVSYLLSNFGGRHEFKGGYEYNSINNDVDRGYASNGIIQLFYGESIQSLLGDDTVPQSANQIGSGVLQRVQTTGSASNRNDALYIQDKWQPINRLTLTLGVRVEKEALPAFNGQTTDLSFGFGEKFAPRLGAAFDLTGDGKTKISAFYGQFYDRLKFELPRGSFGGDFFRLDYFEILPDAPRFDQQIVSRIIGNFGDPIGGSAAIPINAGRTTRRQQDFRVPSNLPDLQLEDGALLQPGAVDPDLKPFRQSEFVFEFQRELFNNSALKARYLFRNVDNAVEDAGFRTSTGSEFYIIANPGEGLHAQRAAELGFAKTAKPQRRYDAFQIEYDSRFLENFNLNVNYTFSRLFGNYSGLASSDEAGRTSPGVNRFFDQPFVGFTLDGVEDNGRLATDRPHVFKASGTYSFDYGNSSNNTDLSFFTTIQSGTPQTTFAEIFDVVIVAFGRGDLGRTETFSQTDFNLTHRYRFGRDGKFTIAGDFNVLNAFNENNTLGVFNQLYDPTGTRTVREPQLGLVPNEGYLTAVNRLLTTGIRNEYLAFVNNRSAATGGDPRRFDNRLGLPNLFQNPRQVRFGFRLLF